MGGSTALVVLALLMAACGGSGAGAPAAAPGVDATGANATGGTVPAVHLGPQGDVGQFVVKCSFSHAASDDPIVHPGHTGASHRHDFFGNRDVDAHSTAATLVGHPTTCTLRQDSAAYWAPSLFDHSEPVTPLGSIAYYRPAPAVDPASLQPYPAGLVMIGGDPEAGEQPTSVAAWSCGTSSDLRSSPPTCPTASPLRMRITFPDCWNGVDVDAPDHRAHVARSVDGRCPTSHPVPIPQLTFFVRYPISGDGHELSLSSGPPTSAHADFLNAWDQAELTTEVDLCLHRNVVCNVASNRGETEPQPD